MLYHLLPQNLHIEVCQLLPIFLAKVIQEEERHAEESRRNGFITAYSSVVPMTTIFCEFLKALTPLGLNKWGLPCNPQSDAAISQHRLVPTEQMPYVKRFLRKLSQQGIADEVVGTPMIEVTDRYRLRNDTEEFEVEHWNEAAALETLQSTPWIQDKAITPTGMSGGYAIGSITRLPSEPTEAEMLLAYDLLDPAEIRRQFEQGAENVAVTTALSMEATLRMQSELERISDSTWSYASNGQVIERAENTLHTNEDENDCPF